MKVQSTSDIPLAALKQAALILPSEWKVEVDEEQTLHKSMDAPSWVSVVAELPWWGQLFAAAASVYLSGIVSEAGKDTWRNRGKIAAAMRRAPSAVATMANFFLSARAMGTSKTIVLLAVPILDQYQTAALELEHSTVDELEFSIVLFVRHLPALEALLLAEGLIDRPPIDDVQLQFREDCSLEVIWMDSLSLNRHRRVLPF